MQIICTSHSVRILKPSVLTNNKWHVEEFNSRKIYAVPQLAISILIYCFAQKSKNDVITQFANYYKISNEIINSLLITLNNNNLIYVDSNDESAISNSALYEQSIKAWKQHNWQAAAEYHFSTYDYPFLDYRDGADGWQIADTRMKDYSAVEPDTDRLKTYPENFRRVELSLPSAGDVDNFARQCALGSEHQLSLKQLTIIAGLSFAKIAEATMRWIGSPLIRRTSPSGGSRHPTEGYLIARGIGGLEDGIYHVQSDPLCFVKLKEYSVREINKIFAHRNDNGLHPSAFIVLTSVFARNMYRYREARTYRTVHMDVGHILGTVELLSNQLNVQTMVEYEFDEHVLQNLLDIDGISEGVIAVIELSAGSDISNGKT
jgi:SagB-type dehydrogenase family enzyme